MNNEFKKGVSIILVAATMIGFSACSKKQNDDSINNNTSYSNTEEVSNQEVKKTYEVYVYNKPVLVSYVDIASKIGEKVKLAENDEFATDAYSAMNGEFVTDLSDVNLKEPVVSAIAYVDKDGNIKQSYKKGTTTSDLDLAYVDGKPQVAYLISDNGEYVGWTSYNNDELKLVEDTIIETSYIDEVPSDSTFVRSYESDNDVHFNGSVKKDRTYLLK